MCTSMVFQDVREEQNHYRMAAVEREQTVKQTLDTTVGIYNYKHGSDFVKYAHQMIDKNIRINNEFYVAPVYNEMIDAGMKIVFNDVGIKMFGTGTPEDLNIFMETDVCKKCF